MPSRYPALASTCIACFEHAGVLKQPILIQANLMHHIHKVAQCLSWIAFATLNKKNVKQPLYTADNAYTGDITPQLW